MTVDDLFMSALIMWTGSTATFIFYPGWNRFDKAKFISAEIYRQSDITDSVAVPLMPSQQL